MSALHTPGRARLYEVELIHRVLDWDATLKYEAPDAKTARKWALRKMAAPSEWLVVRAAVTKATGESGMNAGSKNGHEFHGPIELRPRMEAEAGLTPLERELLSGLRDLKQAFDLARVNSADRVSFEGDPRVSNAVTLIARFEGGAA